MKPVILFRHGPPRIRPDVPAAEWELSSEGAGAVRRLATALPPGTTVVISSDEPKAVATAEAIADTIGASLGTDPRLREVGRPHAWDPSYRQTALAYLGGAVPPGWERPTLVADRMRRAVAGLPAGCVVVGHGIAITLLVASMIDGVDAQAFWADLALPDAWHLRPPEISRVSADA